MTSFAKARDERRVAYYEGTMDYEELALLWEQNVSKNPSFPCKDYEKFDLETMNPVKCKAEFRFEKNHRPSLAEALQIPDTVTFFCQQRSVCDGMEGLCTALEILLSFAIQRHDFSLRQTCASAFHLMITNTVVDFIYNTHGHRIMQWNKFLLDQIKLEQYAEAVAEKRAALGNCWGFIEGTVRPQNNQRVVYNGHKRVHAIKFQSVTVPCALIAQTYGPVGKCQSY